MRGLALAVLFLGLSRAVTRDQTMRVTLARVGKGKEEGE